LAEKPSAEADGVFTPWVWFGTKYVVLPFTNLQIVDRKIILPGGTKDALKALPDYKYAT
jgi:hypothetical protein